MTQVTVVRDNKDPLIREEWRFWFDDWKCNLVLDTYTHLTRRSKRHKWVVEKHYERLSHQRSELTLDYVPYPLDVAEEARRLFTEKVIVVKKQNF
jgi:hypothetical protein